MKVIDIHGSPNKSGNISQLFDMVFDEIKIILWMTNCFIYTISILLKDL